MTPFAAAVIAVNCGGKSPIAPEPTLVSIAIDPGSPEVGVGAIAQLAARARFSDGTTEAATVTWSVTPNSVATVTTAGQLLGVRLGIATVRAVHSSGLTAAALVNVVASASVPIPPQSDMSGLWSGQYTLDRCTRVSGDGPDSCRFIEGARRPIALQVSQNGSKLTGQLTIDALVTGPITGWRDAFGFHVIFGTLTGTGELAGFSFELTEWDAKTTIALNSLTGTFEGIQRFTAPAAGPQVYIIGGTFVDVKR